MLRTISIGSCVSIQGLMIGQQPDGKVKILVDEKTYIGQPVPTTTVKELEKGCV
jgi:hypothetical protein